jgi:signal transduction histidine kinase
MSSPIAHRLRDRLVWKAYAALALALGIAYFVLRDGSQAQLVVYQVSGLGAPLAIAVGLRLHRPAHKRHWLLIAGGLVLWMAGDGYWDSYAWILHEQAPYPSPADVAYLGAYPLFIGGLLVLLRGWGRPRLGDLLDGAIIAGAAACIAGVVMLETLLATDASAFETTIVIGFPVADLLMLAALVQLLFRARTPNFSLRCVIVGIVFLLLADTVYSLLNLTGSYTSGMFIDAGWLVNYALWGVAALHPSMAGMRAGNEDTAPGLSSWRIATLSAALVAAPVALVVEMTRGSETGFADLGIIVALSLLVGARFLLMQRERVQAQAALALSEREYRDLFEEADDARATLAAQNEQLREFDRLKDDLIALVSHELRTPLTSIVGYLDLVREDDAYLTDEHRHFLTVVDRNAERLLSLVSDLLFVAQVQAGRMTLKSDRLRLRDLCEQAVSAAAPTAQTRSIELAFVCHDDGNVIGDPQRLAQVIDNLLSNALKFTPPLGTVTLSVLRDADDVIVEVADTGLGISPEEQERLFTRFFRTEAAREQAIQGTGLGLSIVKAIVEGHHGTISVESAEGRGATFRVVLPAAVAVETEELQPTA